MEQLLPENVAKLKIALEISPCSHTSPVYPFSGYVVNLNVSTRAHRDLQDKKICLIIVISSEDCIGGELCLVEPGLVLRLRNGDAIVFASATLTHFNTHYISRRVSLVQWATKLFKCFVNIQRFLSKSRTIKVTDLKFSG